MPRTKQPFDGTSRALFLPQIPDALDRVLEREAIERFVERRRHETTHHIRPMHPSPPSRMDDDWQPPSQEPPGFTQPDPRTTPVVRCIETRRSIVTMSPIPRPTRQGAPIPGWKKPDPNIEDRDQMIYRLAYEEGVQEQAVIAKRLIEAGFEAISAERIGQILRAHSGRDRILRFLAQAPEGQTFTVRDLAQNLSIDAGRIMYTLDGLAKRHLVTFRNVRNDGVNSGDHKTKIDIALDKRARRSAAVASVMGRLETPPTLVPFADQAAADARLHEAEAVFTAKPSEVVLNEISVVAEPPVPSWTVIEIVGAETIAEAEAKSALQRARLLQQEINDLGAGAPQTVKNSDLRLGAPEPEPVTPWGDHAMLGWPLLRAIRDRHNKAIKIKAALALLEEVGEDDAVLALLDKVTFTPLEEEVVQLLRFLKEIE
jgi:DNA-binding transcriptional ArsR family regulator